MILRMMRMIMTPNYDPWVDIPTAPIGQFSRRRVSAATNRELFWFRDETDRPGLLIGISRDIPPVALQEARINIRDISVDVVEASEEKIRALIIRLENDQNRDVFLKLCIDLIDRVVASKETENVFHVICKRLKKWQSLLSGKERNLLSANEIQGLYAELYFLAEMLMEDPSCESLLVRGWEGSEKTQQDFILYDTAIEVKSVSGNQRGKIRISSEDQLDTHLTRLYLRVYFLSETQSGGESLNAIVQRIVGQLTERKNTELFEIKLETARYIDIPEYDIPLFRVKSCHTYLASEGFPRITRKTLPEGIEAVSYDLVLSSIEAFRADTIDITGE